MCGGGWRCQDGYLVDIYLKGKRNFPGVTETGVTVSNNGMMYQWNDVTMV